MENNRSAKTAFNRARELSWYHAGRDAFNNGKTFDEWPRIGELKTVIVKGKEVTLYPRIRYIARDAWQLGWANAYHALENDMNGQNPPTSDELANLAMSVLMDTPQRLKRLIDELAPVRLRSLPGHFGMKERKDVVRLIKEWAEKGAIQITGKGKRNDPFIVTKESAA